MLYQYQVDYGGGYEDVFIDESEAPVAAENPAQWLAEIEAETAVRRARVLLGGKVVEERDFACTVTRNSILPDGSAEYSVQCSGGSVIVKRKSDGALAGEIQAGYAGDAESGIERAIAAVKILNTD